MFGQKLRKDLGSLAYKVFGHGISIESHGYQLRQLRDENSRLREDSMAKIRKINNLEDRIDAILNYLHLEEKKIPSKFESARIELFDKVTTKKAE